MKNIKVVTICGSMKFKKEIEYAESLNKEIFYLEPLIYQNIQLYKGRKYS